MTDQPNTSPEAVERFHNKGMCPDDHGAWVFYNDYAALSAELATARELIALLEGEQARAEAALARRDAVIAGLVEAAKKAQEEVRQAFINAGVPPEKSAVIAHLKKAIAAAKEAQDD